MNLGTCVKCMQAVLSDDLSLTRSSHYTDIVCVCMRAVLCECHETSILYPLGSYRITNSDLGLDCRMLD